MFRQLDRQLAGRLVIPWLPPFVLWVTNRLQTISPEFLGSVTTILAARLTVDAAYEGSFALLFGVVPLLGGVLLIGGAVLDLNAAWVYYVIAALGTVLAVITDIRQRR
jgi:hypothetical protein